jgi:hypothetical protein
MPSVQCSKAQYADENILYLATRHLAHEQQLQQPERQAQKACKYLYGKAWNGNPPSVVQESYMTRESQFGSGVCFFQLTWDLQRD